MINVNKHLPGEKESKKTRKKKYIEAQKGKFNEKKYHETEEFNWNWNPFQGFAFWCVHLCVIVFDSITIWISCVDPLDFDIVDTYRLNAKQQRMGREEKTFLPDSD